MPCPLGSLAQTIRGPEDLLEFIDGMYIEHEEIQGWGARLSAPGYLDCTDWCVFDTAEEAKEHLREMYDAEI